MKNKTLIAIITISIIVSGLLLFNTDNAEVTIVDLGNSKSKEEYQIEGIKDAEKDLVNGIYKIETYGLPGPTREYYSDVLSEYGVQLDSVAGCVVNKKILGHSAGYNYTMKQAIKKKYGESFFIDSQEEANLRYETSKIKNKH